MTQEVRAILPLDPMNIDQPQVDLVDERGGLENVPWTLARHVPLRKAPQLVVDERQQPVHGPDVAASPFDQKRGHVVGPDVGHSPSILRPSGMTAVLVRLRLPPQQAASTCREGRRDCLASFCLLCVSGVY